MLCVCQCPQRPIKLQAVVSFLAWVLGIKLGSSGRAASALITTEPSLQPQEYSDLLKTFETRYIKPSSDYNIV